MKIFLNNCVVGIAVIAWCWVCDGHGLSVIEGESFVEIWAMWETCEIFTNLGEVLSIELSLSLDHLVVLVAVESYLWEWHRLGLSIGEGEPLIEIWAMLETVD